MADKDMEQWAREDAQRIDTPGPAPGVAVPGDEAQKGRLVNDARSAFESQQGQQGQAPRQTTAPKPMGMGKTGDEARGKYGGGKAGMGKSKVVTGTAQGETVTVRGACGVARAEEAYVAGAAGAVISAGDTKFTGGTVAVVTGGETKINGGGAPLIISRDEIEIEKGGGALLIAPKIEIEEHGYAGIALGRVQVESGGKVLISTVPAILMGAAFGAAFALVSSMIKGGRREREQQRGLFERAREALTPQEAEQQGMLGKMAGGITGAALLSRLGGEQGMMSQLREQGGEAYSRAARANARREVRKAWRDARNATKHAQRATKEALTGRF